MYKGKWYLETWFIVIMFCFSIFIVPFIVGVVLLILQLIENDRLKKIYGKSDQLNQMIEHKNDQLKNIEDKTNNLFSDMQKKELELNKKYDQLNSNLESEHIKFKDDYSKKRERIKSELRELKDEYSLLTNDLLVEHYKFSEYDALTSDECKNQLALLKNDIQTLIKDSKAVQVFSSGSKKEINDNIKQIVRCFNTECDNILPESVKFMILHVPSLLYLYSLHYF